MSLVEILKTDRSAQLKFGTAVIALLIAGVLLVYQFTGAPKTHIEIDNPALTFIHQVTAGFPYEGFPNVTMSPSEDEKSVLVKGLVASEAEKSDLQKRLTAVQPTFPYALDVKIKGR